MAGRGLAGICDAQAVSWLKWSEEVPRSVEQAAMWLKGSEEVPEAVEQVASS
jgi:hypothetical protein